jgi:hypothetical protein
MWMSAPLQTLRTYRQQQVALQYVELVPYAADGIVDVTVNDLPLMVRVAKVIAD